MIEYYMDPCGTITIEEVGYNGSFVPEYGFKHVVEPEDSNYEEILKEYQEHLAAEYQKWLSSFDNPTSSVVEDSSSSVVEPLPSSVVKPSPSSVVKDVWLSEDELPF